MLSRWFYTLLTYVLIPLLLIRLWWRSLKAPIYRERWYQRLGLGLPKPERPSIWVHAVSVGEVQAIEPLIRLLLDRYPQLQVVVTTTTPTGAQRLLQLFSDEVMHAYAPFDAGFILTRFYDAFQPQHLILVETEIWPNLIHLADQKGIPTLLANARLSARSYRRYRKALFLLGDVFRKITKVAPHAVEDGERFAALGVDRSRIEVTGSIKFDIRLPASTREASEVLRRFWGMERSVWLAASTHEGEEAQLLDAHRMILEQRPDALLILVPRHPERFGQVAELVQSNQMSLARRSTGEPCGAEIQVYLADTMGELPLFYGAVDSAFIGGSLVPVGGHNLLEASAQGVPVIVGPHMFNFADIANLFLRRGAAVRINNPSELAERLLEWFDDASKRSQIGEMGYQLVECNRGALERLYEIVRQLLAAQNINEKAGISR